MKIAQILGELGITPVNGEINLGNSNRWDTQGNTLYKRLYEFRQMGTDTKREYTRNITEYSFTISDGTDEYILVYIIDYAFR